MDHAELVVRLLDGDRRALARLLTWLEDAPGSRIREAVALLHGSTGSAQLVGVTGAPGVGKSTLVNALISQWRSQGRGVAVLAVDPSSPFTGGALLGDRVRLQEHALDPGVFIRSMASRGRVGGLSPSAPLALLVLDAAGFDVVVVETVGVGQGEVEVASVTDTTVVALAPEMGDAVQMAKAGLLEIADVLCLNKADLPGAARMERVLRDVHTGAAPSGVSARPALCVTAASSGRGVAELADAIDGHYRLLAHGGQLATRRRRRARLQIHAIALDEVRNRFGAGGGGLLEELAAQVADRRSDPFSAAERLVASLDPDASTAS